MPIGDTRDAVINLPIPVRTTIERFEAVERLSELFIISVLVLCDDFVDFFPLLGTKVGITVSHEGEAVRAFHGLLFEADYVGESSAGHRYHLTLRPWLYVLSRNLDYAIFQEKGARDIIQAVFDKRGWGDIDFSQLAGNPAPRDYCVQYRESDFAFVSRLMEEEGIYYYFRHEADRHTLVLCDGRASHKEADYISLPFVSPTGGVRLVGESRLQTDRVWLWNERAGTGAEGDVKLRNFDFERPATPREGRYSDGFRTPVENAEIYDFPARFLEPDEGKARGEMILQAARRQRQSYIGEGDATALFCGALVKLARHPIDRLNQDYLITDLRYSLESQKYRSGESNDSPAALVSIEAVPADTPWRGPFVTPRPVARGPQTAIVTGPAGETIYTDKYGRVKVRFHWDRSDSQPEDSTCFIRVSHSSAGADFGHLVLPRLGQEVIVDFLDGDPDRPIVVGRVYNRDHMQAEKLTDEKTRSTWRSKTIGEIGSYDGAEVQPQAAKMAFNLIGMEDKGGSELLRFWASRDRWTTVWRDDRLLINRDETRRVGRNRKTDIKNNETTTIEDGDETHTVESGKRITSIKMNEELKVTDGDMKTEVSKGNQSTKVSMGNQDTEISMGNMSADVKMGNYSLKTDLGKIEVEAMQSIELKVGGNSVKIDQMGVTIIGLVVKAEGQVMLQITAPMTQVNGDGMTTVKGGVVMIN